MKKDDNKKNEMNCKKLQTKNNPKIIYGYASIVYHKNKIYLFTGGCDTNQCIYCLDLSINEWNPLKLTGNTNKILNKLIEHHTIHIWNNHIIICCATNNYGIVTVNLNENNQLNFFPSNAINPIGNERYHSSIVINDKLVIYGGQSHDDFIVISLTNLINNKKISMTKLNIKFNPYCCGMAYINKKLFCLGTRYRNGSRKGTNLIINNIFESNKISVLKNTIEYNEFPQPGGFVMFVLRDSMQFNVIIFGGYIGSFIEDAYCLSIYTNKLNK